MNGLVKYHETESDSVYSIESDIQGLVSVPKELKDNIKIFLMFRDSKNKDNDNDNDKNNTINEMNDVSKNINKNGENGLCIVAFIDGDVLVTDNVFTYTELLNKIKELINIIYNNVRNEKNLSVDNFIKKVELLYEDEKFKDLMDFLCLQDPSRFHANSYQDIVKNNTSQNLTSSDSALVATKLQDSTSLQKGVVQDISNKNLNSDSNFGISNTQQNPYTVQSQNISPKENVNSNFNVNSSFGNESQQNDVVTNNSVSTFNISQQSGFGSSLQSNTNVQKPNLVNNGGIAQHSMNHNNIGGLESQSYSNTNVHSKPLTKTLKLDKKAFINLPSVILILAMSLIVGISISLYLLK